MKSLLEVRGISKSFGGVKALFQLSLSVGAGEFVGLIGPNGAGKSTLFDVISGFLAPDGGGVRFRGKDYMGAAPDVIAAAGVARTFQRLRVLRQMSVLDNLLIACPGQPGERLGNMLFARRASSNREAVIRREGERLLAEFDLAPFSQCLAGELSYGQQKVLSLAACIAKGSSVLLLDEPVAGLDPSAITRVLGALEKARGLGVAGIIIEHNLDAIAEICQRFIVLDCGNTIAEGPPEVVRQRADVVAAYLHATEA